MFTYPVGFLGAGATPVDAFFPDQVDLVRAYSLDRKLVSTYVGSIFRVRRSSDNAELDIGFTGSNLVDEVALTSFVGANDAFVVTIYDQKGTTNDPTNATAGQQPQIVVSGTINKDGLGKIFMDASSGKGLRTITGTVAQPGTLFSVFKVNSNIGGTDRWIDSGTADKWLLGQDGVTTDFAIFGGSTFVTSSIFDTDRHIWTGILDGLNGDVNLRAVLRLDSVQIANGSGGLDDFTGVTIGGNGANGDMTRGDINFYELLIYDANKSANQTSIEANIDDFYRVTLLPAQTGLARAYSISRLLVDDYSGPLFKVRRSSDNAELDIGFTAEGVTDEAALEAFVSGGANDGLIVTVYDQTGNLNVTQGSATAQPRVVNNGIAAKDAAGRIYADALSDNRRWGAGAGVVTTVGAWFFVVHRQANTGSDAVYFARGNTSAIDRWNMITRTAVDNYQINIHTSTLTSAPKDTNQHLFTGFQDGANAELYKDGGLEDSAVDGPGGIPAMSIMGRRDGAGGVDGFFYEFIVYDDTITASRTDIEDNVNDFFQIY